MHNTISVVPAQAGTHMPYDIFKDFEPVTNVVLGTGYLLVLHPAVSASSVKELIALARESIVSGGYEPDGRSPAEFRQFLRLEHERYAEILRVANVPKTAH